MGRKRFVAQVVLCLKPAGLKDANLSWSKILDEERELITEKTSA